MQIIFNFQSLIIKIFSNTYIENLEMINYNVCHCRKSDSLSKHFCVSTLIRNCCVIQKCCSLLSVNVIFIVSLYC